jgi:uncharacterized protein (TIGR02300 family)
MMKKVTDPLAVVWRLRLTLLPPSAQSPRHPHIKATQMSTNAASKLGRGTKRTCQNSECGAKFYDLNREPIICPICNTAYSLVLATPAPPPGTVRGYQKPVKKREVAIDDIRPDAVAEGDELAPIETEEEHTVEDDETLIEEVEEDSPDVAGIIDGSVEAEDKT